MLGAARRFGLAAEVASVEAWWKGCGVAQRGIGSAPVLPRACVTNLKTLNYDNGIALGKLSSVVDQVTSHDYSTAEEIIERTKGYDVAITKEVPVTADMSAPERRAEPARPRCAKSAAHPTQRRHTPPHPARRQSRRSTRRFASSARRAPGSTTSTSRPRRRAASSSPTCPTTPPTASRTWR